MTNEMIRLAAVGDIHCGKSSQGALQPLFARATEVADVLVLCGDLTDYGLPEEAHVLQADRRYERLNVTGVTGLTDAQRQELLALGAIDDRARAR